MTAIREYLLLLSIVVVLVACTRKNSTSNNQTLGAHTTRVSDTVKADKNSVIEDQNVALTDSLVVLDDSLFIDLGLDLKEISKSEFQSYKKKYKTTCILDPGRFIKDSGLYVSDTCNEICETYLIEKSTNRKMLIPSSYDAGIITMLLSPSCNQLLVCSSYDGPDYGDYYENRAEIIGFNVTLGSGLRGITPAFKCYTKDWSIDDVTWIGDKTIALKIYEESRTGDGSGVHYKYAKADLGK